MDVTDSPHTRAKRLAAGSTSPAKKLKIVERYTMGPYELGFRRQQDLTHEINTNNNTLSQLMQEIAMSRAKKSTQEIENCKLESELEELRKHLRQQKSNLENLRVFEEDSLQTLDDVYALKRKEIDVVHNEQLLQLKESVSGEIELAISKARQDALAQKNDLDAQTEALAAKVQAYSTETNRKLIKVKEDHHRKLLQLEESMDAMQKDLQSNTDELKRDIAEKKAEIERLNLLCSTEVAHETSRLQKQLGTLEESQSAKNAELASLRERADAVRQKISNYKASFAAKREQIETYKASAEALQKEYPQLEEQRKRLHNRLQELKGNIRVFCRLRPPLSTTDALAHFTTPTQGDMNENGKQELAVDVLATSDNHSRPLKHNFQFDKIFDNASDNREIFLEISQLIQSSLDGYNVCVFAYGQTGSGKTWTMSHHDDGMIPLSISKIFEDIKELEAQGWEYTVEGQFVEIYNEQIVDLLEGPTPNVKYEIRHDDTAGLTTITNCKTITLQSKQQAIEVLDRATNKRSTAATMANSRSSRSHCVFIFKIFGKHQQSGKTSNGRLNLIDLAGSERLNSSQAKGDRLKETQAINKSLSSLGDVIHGLAQQQNNKNQSTHIPYRNSKLTYLLKHSLGGELKTLMFVNISPFAKNVGETVNSLRFASKVNGTKLE